MTTKDERCAGFADWYDLLHTVDNLKQEVKEMHKEIYGLKELKQTFTNHHYEVVQIWFSETMLKNTDKCLKEWLEDRNNK